MPAAKRRPVASAGDVARRAVWPFAVALIVVGAALFANSLRGPFIFDDIASIPENPTIRSLVPITGPLTPPSHSESVAGRPIVNLSLAVNYAAGGLNVAGYHAVNIVIHLACALLLFGIVRRMLLTPQLRDRFGADSLPLAAVCALVWMVHPLQTEAVDYTVARTESLMALFLLLTLYCWIRAGEGTKGWYAAAIVACAAGMACKETMAVAPLGVIAYDAAFAREKMRGRVAAYAALGATWLVLAALVGAGGRTHSAGFNTVDVTTAPVTPWTYLLNQCPIIVRYLRLLLWPSGLVLDYGYPRPLTLADVWPAGGLILILAAAAAVAWRRWRAAAFAATVFFLVLAPSSSFIPIVTEVGAERRMYVPAMALIALAIVGLFAIVRRTALLVAVLLCVPLAAATLARNREYQSPLVMWQTVVDRRPNGRAYSNLAMELQKAGRTSELIPLLRLAVRDLPDAEYDLGAQLYFNGQNEEAIEHLAEFLRVRAAHPKAPDARTLLLRAWTAIGIDRARRGDAGGAVQAFTQAVAVEPSNPDLQRNLANALLDSGDRAGAARQARETLRLRPGDATAQEILDLATRPEVR